jgi:6-phosphogluconolactonase (cycloisomerase 2 family)
MDASPTQVTVASIDFEEDRVVPFSYEDGMVTAEIGALPASVAIVAE